MIWRFSFKKKNFKERKKREGDLPVNFPKRLELLLRRVLAFPKASRIGLASRTLFSSSSIFPTPPVPLTAAKNLITCLQLSVLPAPDSPLDIKRKDRRIEERIQSGFSLFFFFSSSV
jgi:hypothetical protein